MKISDTSAPTPGALETACAPCPNAEGGAHAPASSSDTPTADDRRFAAKLLAIQSLAYQRILLMTSLREYTDRAYRKRDEIDDAITDLTRGMKMPVVGQDFIIKSRRQSTVANQEHLSPSQRKRARMRSTLSVELAA